MFLVEPSILKCGMKSKLPSNQKLLEIRSVGKKYGNKAVLKSFTLDVYEGEFLTLLGESGSGKTTLLRIIAGFETLDSGEVLLSGSPLSKVPPYQRPINTVFQHYALFPHLSVFENVAYGLRAKKTPEAEIPSRVKDALAMVKMSDFEQSSPKKLSGGQQQRIALARALVNRPKLLLLDEPLSALDANLRRQMQYELKSLQRELGITFLFVTHDQDEAMALSDRVALLKLGELEQVSSPREIYHKPATRYTAKFIGRTNLIEAQVTNNIAKWNSLSWSVAAPDGPALFSLRPENIYIAGSIQNTTQSKDEVSFEADVLHQTFEGAQDLIEVSFAGKEQLQVQLTNTGELNKKLQLAFQPKHAVLISERS